MLRVRPQNLMSFVLGIHLKSRLYRSKSHMGTVQIDIKESCIRYFKMFPPDFDSDDIDK